MNMNRLNASQIPSCFHAYSAVSYREVGTFSRNSHPRGFSSLSRVDGHHTAQLQTTLNFTNRIGGVLCFVASEKKSCHFPIEELFSPSSDRIQPLAFLQEHPFPLDRGMFTNMKQRLANRCRLQPKRE
jgi:hypothetical protein